jgi:hypothetical protein
VQPSYQPKPFNSVKHLGGFSRAVQKSATRL